MNELARKVCQPISVVQLLNMLPLVGGMYAVPRVMKVYSECSLTCQHNSIEVNWVQVSELGRPVDLEDLQTSIFPFSVLW